MEELGEAFDIGEEEGDGAAWKIHDEFASTANLMISSIVIA